MKQFPNLTLKRVQRRNKKIAKRYPEDEKIHKTVEDGSVRKKEFLKIVGETIKPH